MVKDKIIELENGTNYYILEEITYNDSKYILAVECNLDTEEVNEDEYIVQEIKLNNADLVTANIEDDAISQTVTKLLIEKVRNQK
ncbi:MAG: DUF1292 domain-containing protein [Bacilli bacterium]|nr:DUF1292 domain-containing protein [Bacilli bacterium]